MLQIESPTTAVPELCREGDVAQDTPFIFVIMPELSFPISIISFLGLSLNSFQDSKKKKKKSFNFISFLFSFWMAFGRQGVNVFRIA